MTSEKAKLSKLIDNQILASLRSSKNPLSTRDLSLKIRREWHAVQTHCLKLQLKGKLIGYTVTNMNVWEISKK